MDLNEIMTPQSPSPPPTSPQSRKRVTREHTLERVRNNQRRHRARHRDYVTTLEQKLQEAEERAAALQGEVDSLKTELARYRGKEGGGAGAVAAHLLSAVCAAAQLSEPGFAAVGGQSTAEQASAATQSPCCRPAPGTDAQSSTTCVQGEPRQPANGFPPGSSGGSSSGSSSSSGGTLLSAAAADEEGASLVPAASLQSCADRCGEYRPCSEGESTTTCGDAYALIAQQNFKGINQEDAARWLGRGFRKPLDPKEGCRVKTDLLFGLLAYISDA